MTLLATKSLALTLGQTLFTDLSFSLEPGDRLGLIAANGRGKSSLLRCLAGTLGATSGEVTRARGLKAALVDQNVPASLLTLTFREATLKALPADQADYESWRAEIVLDDLSIPEALRDTPLSALSGGWQRTALLARAAIHEPDLYLLDEPTNHLDLSRIGILQRWLTALPRDTAVITTSHDRAFLDAATTRSLFLRATASRIFALPYSRARAALEESDAADSRRFENDLNKADQLRRQAAKLKNIGINSGSDLLITKTKQLKDRAEKLEAAARPAHRETSSGAIRLANSGTHAKALITLSDAAITTPDARPLFHTGQKWIERGDRVVILGANGTGKSQLIRAVLAAIQGQPSAIKAVPTLVLGYSDQNLAQLPDTLTPQALISQHANDQTTKTLLAGAGIKPDWQVRPLGKLSGGQKARLAMLLLRLSNPNFYLLDEPTNHLDIEGQEALESELLTQGATCLLVSHDRDFIRAVGSRFWQVEKRKLIEVDSPEPFFATELNR
ncbi:MAG: ABC-F family ATP-binding cassette domain-containing protein [Cypionkella sp.]|uniref:ABC-F family ATP-binding cassette domain-containing protein n=1 Tax=Cypionkella sp. TaxID=2811411 RepID=UPI002AB96D6E|nr:ABC-F family ATP-binding cassette domain-containing protein [Cypionkella sp.]MDZ4311207.1 ABC-F family ATP-binding cassette domain-containing protein [Cypionkella sp.]